MRRRILNLLLDLIVSQRIEANVERNVVSLSVLSLQHFQEFLICFLLFFRRAKVCRVPHATEKITVDDLHIFSVAKSTSWDHILILTLTAFLVDVYVWRCGSAPEIQIN